MSDEARVGLVSVGEVIRDVARRLSEDTTPEPCPECRADMRAVGWSELRDPMTGCELTLCPTCAADYPMRRRRDGILSLLTISGVPRRYHAADPASVLPALWQQIKSWRGRPEVLTIAGPTGTGKSMAAACLVRELLLEGYSCRWRQPLGIVAELRGDLEGASAVVEHLCRAKVLILDDLGAERWTDYALEQMTLIIFRRWDEQRWTIVTTNATPDELHASSPKIASRIFGGLAVGLGGIDRRLQRDSERR